MKKILAILLVCVFALSVVACGGETDDVSTPSTSTPSNSAPTTPTTPDDNSSGTSSNVSTPVDSSASDVPSTSDSSTPVEDNPVVEVSSVPQFISWKNAYYDGGIVANKATDATSLPLNKINKAPSAGETVALTFDFGATIKADDQDYSEFAVVVFEYDHSKSGYVQKSFADVGTANPETAIPRDGFVVVISQDNTAKIEAIKAAADKIYFFHGYAVNDGLDAEINKTTTAPVIDGTVADGEYGDAIWEINPENELFSYAQFKTEVNAKGNAYATWDDEYLYIAIVIDTPDHFVTIDQNTVTQMWDQTCIQMNICSVAPNGDYIANNFHQDGGMHEPANANIIRQYGLCYSTELSESLKTIFFGDYTFDNSTFAGSRNGQLTTYEIAIPWSDLGPTDAFVNDLVPSGRFVPEVGKEIGISFSVNSGTAENKFQNITMRDGGGVIGSNDWAKIPTITLAD